MKSRFSIHVAPTGKEKMKIDEVKKRNGLKDDKRIVGYSSSLRLSLRLGDTSSVDLSSQAVVQLLEALPLAHECSISVHVVPSPTFLEEVDYFLSVWEKIRFGAARLVPTVYMFVPRSVNFPKVVECIEQHNDVAQQLRSEADLVSYWEITHRCSIDHIVLVRATTLNQFPCAFKRFRRISGILCDYTPAIWLHVDDLPKYFSQLDYMELLQTLPFIRDTLDGVPLLPQGPLDVLYCATQLAKHCLPHEEFEFQMKELMWLCIVLRNNYFEFRQDEGRFAQIPPPTIGYVHFARFIGQHSKTIAAVEGSDTQTTARVRKFMADYVND